jgi:hypothetical protein
MGDKYTTMYRFQKLIPLLANPRHLVRNNHHSTKPPHLKTTSIDNYEITLKLKYLESQLLQLTKRLQTLENNMYYPDYESRIHPTRGKSKS